MKVLKAIARLITNPLSAAIICLGGGYVIWLAVAHHPDGAPTANRGRMQAPGNGRIMDSRSDALGRGNTEPNKTGGTRTKSGAHGGAASRSRSDAKRAGARSRGEEYVEHFEAENEPLEPAMKPGTEDRTDRPSRATDAASAMASSADVITPLDPRAKALAEYPAKKAAIPDTAAANKELALWCDQHGLWDGAKTHWEAVVRLNPKNEEARKRLGFRFRNPAWVIDAARAEDVEQKKANSYWKVLEKYHAQMKCRSKLAVPGRAEAVAHIEAIGDPRAAAAIWKAFYADISHHGLMVGILSRFKTPEASRMLAAIAVYSQDEKARAGAVAALQGRAAAEFGEKLVSLLRAPMRVQEREVPIPGRAPARMLFVEGDAQNYEFIFSRVEAPTSDSMPGCFQPRLSASEIAMARQFNENQAAIAKQGLNEQVAWAKATIKKYNDSIQSLNQRVASVLNEASGARIRPRA